MSERTLIVLRHAKSAWPPGVPDFERPLGERGRRDAPVAGQWLAENVAVPDLTICSPAVRARGTWELVSAALPAVEVRHDDRLYGEPAETLAAVARELPDSVTTAVFVGHNPVLEDLVELLSGTPVLMKTATIAVVTSSLSWSAAGPGWGALTSTVTPRGE